MKHKTFGTALAAGVLATGLLLGTNTAQAVEVIFGDEAEPKKATAILELDVGGTLYDVTFNLGATAAEIYGPYPGEFPIFNTSDAAQDAVLAVNAALQTAGAFTVGEDSGEGSPIFNIGYESFIFGIGDLESVNVWRGLEETGEWINGLQNQWLYNADPKTYAEFTISGGGEPPPTTAGSLFKKITCPITDAVILPAGGRVEIDDIIVSANNGQIVTVKFSPGDQIITQLSMTGAEPVVINISGQVESLEEQSLRLNCSGTGNLFITAVGSKTGF